MTSKMAKNKAVSCSISCGTKAEELKKKIRSMFGKFSEGSGDFVTGGLLEDAELPAIHNFGLLPVPMTKLIFDSVKKFSKESPYGLGKTTLIDKSVRNSLQIDPACSKIENKIFEQQIDGLVQSKFKTALGLMDVFHDLQVVDL